MMCPLSDGNLVRFYLYTQVCQDLTYGSQVYETELSYTIEEGVSYLKCTIVIQGHVMVKHLACTVCCRRIL